jgi:lipopolysaccharide export system protein LptA
MQREVRVAREREHPEMKGALALTFLLVCSQAGAQAGLTRCNLSADAVESETINGMDISRGRGGIRVNCPSRNLRLSADSGEMFGDERVELYGKVHFEEPSRIDLKSDRLTYFLRDERVIVRGNVIATQPNGSKLTGPEATYYRAVPRVRTVEELLATQYPTVTIAAKGKDEKPVVVRAASIFMKGDSLIYASRSVVIDRADLIARSDSAFVDGRANNETMRLMFKPSVEGREGRKFKLEGDIIDAYSKDRKLQRVIARAKAHALSQDLDLVADTIDLRMSNDAMERAIAWSHGGQAKATSPGQVITADSIDAHLPKQKISVVYAVRRARAESDADSTRFKTSERDWLRGDNVTAWFDSTATKDTSKTPPIDRILATHVADSAQAYYHMPATTAGCRDAAISYVRGREILIDFQDRKVGVVSVKDSVVGVYAEPKCQAPKDSSKAKPATTPAKKPAAKPPSRPLALSPARPR